MLMLFYHNTTSSNAVKIEITVIFPKKSSCEQEIKFTMDLEVRLLI